MATVMSRSPNRTTTVAMHSCGCQLRDVLADGTVSVDIAFSHEIRNFFHSVGVTRWKAIPSIGISGPGVKAYPYNRHYIMKTIAARYFIQTANRAGIGK